MIRMAPYQATVPLLIAAGDKSFGNRQEHKARAKLERSITFSLASPTIDVSKNRNHCSRDELIRSDVPSSRWIRTRYAVFVHVVWSTEISAIIPSYRTGFKMEVGEGCINEFGAGCARKIANTRNDGIAKIVGKSVGALNAESAAKRAADTATAGHVQRKIVFEDIQSRGEYGEVLVIESVPVHLRADVAIVDATTRSIRENIVVYDPRLIVVDDIREKWSAWIVEAIVMKIIVPNVGCFRCGITCISTLTVSVKTPRA